MATGANRTSVITLQLVDHIHRRIHALLACVLDYSPQQPSVAVRP